MLLDIYDPKAPPTPIGIDLGTTHSIVAYLRDGRPTALTTCDATPLLPSVVHYGAHGHVVVGAAALSYATREPTRTIRSAKRLMGRGAEDPETKRLSSYRFAQPKSERDERVVRLDVGERVVTPIEVSAEILKSLRQSAVDQLHQVGGVVITVPAYFDDAQRQATKDAGKLAGLNVLRLLNEPTAAALAYGLDKKRDGLFAVFDLGGGTFDITILTLDHGIFQVRSTGGDSALGGDDMDRLIADKMLEKMGAVETSAHSPELVAVVLEAAREVKHGLTDVERIQAELPGQGGKTVEFVMTRAEFDELISPLLDRTARACKRALRDAGVSPQQIDGVILVGGATRVPKLKQYVQGLFGQPALSDIDPELVVAYGAATQAELLAKGSDDVLLLDVLPLSLGIETMGGAVDKILPRNTLIPCGAKSVFTTYVDNQTGFELHVVQGERELAEDCRSLARFSLKGIPPMPAGMARLEVSFHVDENNLLKVEALELTTGKRQTVEVKPSYGLSDDDVERMLIDALDHGEDDLVRRKLTQAKVEASRIAQATEKSLSVDAELLVDNEQQRISEALSELKHAVETATRASVIESRIDVLDQATHAFAGRRMNQAIRKAIAGQELESVADSVAHAAGVEAHLAAHGALSQSKAEDSSQSADEPEQTKQPGRVGAREEA